MSAAAVHTSRIVLQQYRRAAPAVWYIYDARSCDAVRSGHRISHLPNQPSSAWAILLYTYIECHLFSWCFHLEPEKGPHLTPVMYIPVLSLHYSYELLCSDILKAPEQFFIYFHRGERRHRGICKRDSVWDTVWGSARAVIWLTISRRLDIKLLLIVGYY